MKYEKLYKAKALELTNVMETYNFIKENSFLSAICTYILLKLYCNGNNTPLNSLYRRDHSHISKAGTLLEKNELIKKERIGTGNSLKIELTEKGARTAEGIIENLLNISDALKKLE